ncbi:MAG: hypothetical protein A3H98_05685, partial [Bacteroidetes bacterium RIFCSPLOWO2_02_FULL_36_8]
ISSIHSFAKFWLLIISIVFLRFTLLFSQETITTTGGNLKGTNGSVSYTVGQVVNQTYSGGNGYIIQGVQQPYEISIVTSQEEAKDIQLKFALYPNLTQDVINLIVDNVNTTDLRYQLSEISGRQLTNTPVLNRETQINLSSYPAETFILTIFRDKKIIKTFKIIKIK